LADHSPTHASAGSPSSRRGIRYRALRHLSAGASTSAIIRNGQVQPTRPWHRHASPLWRAFGDLALWVDAPCIHEWALLTERFAARDPRPTDRGAAYRLLTAQPGARRPLTWERHQIRVLLREGATFACPWTGRAIARETEYALDHLLPVALRPINDLWNLAPTDPRFNTAVKRDRLPSPARLTAALPRLAATYALYARSPTLGGALREDVGRRFARALGDERDFPDAVAKATIDLIERFAAACNLPRF
jgi:hypothetical protein